jgi:hypothetical protein
MSFSFGSKSKPLDASFSKKYNFFHRSFKIEEEEEKQEKIEEELKKRRR